MMRHIISEDREQQLQQDEKGRVFIYRKDYIGSGDHNTEFSLSLVYARPPLSRTPMPEPDEIKLTPGEEAIEAIRQSS